MKKPKTRSLLSQVIMVMVGILILSLGILYIPTLFKLRELLRENHSQQLRLVSLEMARKIQEKRGKTPPEKITIKELCRDQDVAGLEAAWLSGEGQIRSSYLSQSLERDYLPRLEDSTSSLFHYGKDRRALILPLSSEGYLFISTPFQLREQLTSYTLFLLVVLVANLLVAGTVVIYALYRIILKPLEGLIAANMGASEGRDEYFLIPPKHIPDNEIGETMRHRNNLIIRLHEFQEKVKEQNQELLSHQKELQKWSRELEARVEAKTRELKAAEERLIRAEKLAALGKLASGVAHEVNNPLASIAGYAEDMTETLRADPQLTEDQVEEFISSLKIIEDQAYRLKELTRKLLNFARETKLNMEEVDLNKLAEETVSLVRLRSRNKTTIAIELSSDLPIISTDRSKVQQVLMNLLDNAVDAVADGGDVRVITRKAGEVAKIIVQDTGCGISPEIQRRIFDPFFTTKPVGSGTGLGLSICYGIVRKLKGTIEFESLPMAGTTFVISLPREIPVPTEVASESHSLAR